MGLRLTMSSVFLPPSNQTVVGVPRSPVPVALPTELAADWSSGPLPPGKVAPTSTLAPWAALSRLTDPFWRLSPAWVWLAGTATGLRELTGGRPSPSPEAPPPAERVGVEPGAPGEEAAACSAACSMAEAAVGL